MTKQPQLMPRVIVDIRERRSSVAVCLERLGVRAEYNELKVGDYVVSDRINFERKEEEDFFNTWFNRKELFNQLYDMRKAYSRGVLLIEGGDPFLTTRHVDVNSIRGVLNTITLRLGVPILYSLSPAETAQIILLAALSEQNREVFSWENVPGKDELRLKTYLIDELKINWTEGASFVKEDDRDLISVATSGGIIKITLDALDSTATIEVDGEVRKSLVARGRRGEFRIYEDGKGREISVHGTRPKKSIGAKMEYVVSAMDDIGPKVARELLLHFGTIENVMRASEEELMGVRLVGPKTAASIRGLVTGVYEPRAHKQKLVQTGLNYDKKTDS